MISFKDMIAGKSVSDIPIAHQQNIDDLLRKVNVLLDAAEQAGVGKFNVVTSGYRYMQDHLRIYKSKGIPEDKIPMKSKHLTGQAVDIFDPDLKLTLWLKTDPKAIVLSQEQGLYFEDGNKNWVHAQSVPPKSGRHWFLP